MSHTYQLRWVSFRKTGTGVMALGFVYNNPCFPDSYYIHTSTLQGMELTGPTLTIHTRNSHYRCYLAELCCEPEEEDELRALLLSHLPHHGKTLAHLAFCRPKDRSLSHQNRALSRLTDQTLASIASMLSILMDLPPNCYILCVNLQCSPNYLFSGFFKKGADERVSLLLKEPLVHLGMFQDSVLCCDDCTYDLRYFPYSRAIKTYHTLYDQDDPSTLPYFICNVGIANIDVNGTDLPCMACYRVPDCNEH